MLEGIQELMLQNYEQREMCAKTNIDIFRRRKTAMVVFCIESKIVVIRKKKIKHITSREVTIPFLILFSFLTIEALNPDF